MGICKYFDSLDITSLSGNSKWSKTTVDSILTSEKYKSDALLQKKFNVAFLLKKMNPYEGAVLQYYEEVRHPAIVEPDEWNKV